MKEKEKKSGWKMRDTKRIGGLATDNKMMFQLGEGLAGKFNLGGAG